MIPPVGVVPALRTRTLAGVGLLGALCVVVAASVATVGLTLWLDSTADLRRLRREFRSRSRS